MTTDTVETTVIPVHEGQNMDRQFGFWSACALGVMTGCSWALMGGSIVISLFNGGPPGVLYEFLAIGVIYILVSASIAELASSIPSSAGVYHWASITGGEKYGRIVGFFAAWWNCAAWIFSTIATCSVTALQLVQMYAMFHDDYNYQQWHVLVCYLGLSWVCCAITIYGQKLLPLINDLGLFLIVGGVIITVLVCVILPTTSGRGYASSSFVWREWENNTGYSNDGWVFVMGMLNGAFALGVPDCVSHVAEEIARPSSNIPKAIFAQLTIGVISTFVYLVAIFYATSDLDDVLDGGAIFPIANIYYQATGSTAGAFGLLFVILLPSFWAIIGAYVTANRMLWALGRDNASPFSNFIGHISPKTRNPRNAIITVCLINSLFGLIYLGSTTAFNAFCTSVICLLLLSYLAAIGPHLISKRSRTPKGYFWMSGIWGYAVNGLTCAYIIVFLVVFCFPYSQPVTAQSMNYTSAIIGGLSIAIILLWFWKRKRGYNGFTAVVVGVDEVRHEDSGKEALSHVEKS